MSLETLIPYIAGPGGAIVVCVLVGWAVYRLLVYFFVPMLQGSIDRHLAQVDEMNSRHSDEHRQIIDALNNGARCKYDSAAK
tara:strand:- start:7736 stop:7981 length:246 start_codon:yes stop_codon:yes gene_type:complete